MKSDDAIIKALLLRGKQGKFDGWWCIFDAVNYEFRRVEFFDWESRIPEWEDLAAHLHAEPAGSEGAFFDAVGMNNRKLALSRPFDGNSVEYILIFRRGPIRGGA